MAINPNSIGVKYTPYYWGGWEKDKSCLSFDLLIGQTYFFKIETLVIWRDYGRTTKRGGGGGGKGRTTKKKNFLELEKKIRKKCDY